MRWERDTVYASRDRWPDAACRGQGAAMTMPKMRRPGPGGVARISHAKALCATCPVRVVCLAWALTEPDPAVGMVAGGATPAERRALRALAVDHLAP